MKNIGINVVTIFVSTKKNIITFFYFYNQNNIFGINKLKMFHIKDKNKKFYIILKNPQEVVIL